jgi:hypothetical protein
MNSVSTKNEFCLSAIRCFTEVAISITPKVRFVPSLEISGARELQRECPMSVQAQAPMSQAHDKDHKGHVDCRAALQTVSPGCSSGIP